MEHPSNKVPLTRVRVGELLRRWGGHLPAGYSAEIMLVGGAWMVLHRLRQTTLDLDVTMGPQDSTVDESLYTPEWVMQHKMQNNVLHITAQYAITDFVRAHPRLPVIRRVINEDLVGTGNLPEAMCIGRQLRIIGQYDPRLKRRGFLTVNLPTTNSILASKLNEMRIPIDYYRTGRSQDRDDITALLGAEGIDHTDPVAVARHLTLTASRHFAPNRIISGPLRYLAASMGVSPWLVRDTKVSILARHNPERLVAAIRRLG